MSAFPRPNTPRGWLRVLAIELFLIGGILGLGVEAYIQNDRQQKVCQAFRFFSEQTQNSIDTNSKLIDQDVKLGTKAAKADAKIRRHSVSVATTFLIHIKSVQC